MLGAFCNTFDLHLAIIGLEIICYMKGLLYGGGFRQVLLHMVDVAEQAVSILPGHSTQRQYCVTFRQTYNDLALMSMTTSNISLMLYDKIKFCY